MAKELSSEETIVIATYSSRHDAEAARSYLEDQGISSFVAADDVHPPLQITEGSRLRVMSSDLEEAREALHYASMLPEEGFQEEQDRLSAKQGSSRSASVTTRSMSWGYIAAFILIFLAIVIGLLI